jgi:integrase
VGTQLRDSGLGAIQPLHATLQNVQGILEYVVGWGVSSGIVEDWEGHWKSQSEYNEPGDFVFPSRRHKGRKPLDLAAVLKKKIQPAFANVGIVGVGWHTFRHTVGTMLADMGEHQLTIRDYLRHSNLHVTNKCLQATPESKRPAHGKDSA